MTLAAPGKLLVDDLPAGKDVSLDALAQRRWPRNVSTVSDGVEAIGFCLAAAFDRAVTVAKEFLDWLSQSAT